MYPGYLSVVVLADMMVETCGEDGVSVRVTASPPSASKSRFAQLRRGSTHEAAPGRAGDPRSRLQAAHHGAQPTGWAQTGSGQRGRPTLAAPEGRAPLTSWLI